MDTVTFAGLSSSGGLIGVLQSTTDLLSICYEYRKHVAGRGRELHDLTAQLTKLLTIQQELMIINASPSWYRLSTTTQELDVILTKYSAELNRLTHRLRVNDQKSSVLRKLRWQLGDNKNLSRAIQILERCKEVISLMLVYLDTTRIREVQGTLEALSQSFADFQIDDNKLKKSLLWLSAPDTSVNHATSSVQRQDSTGSWFTNGRLFSEWMSTQGSMLWLYGHPGCGKTVLCSSIIDETLLRCSSDPLKAVAFFYFDFQDERKRYLDGFVRSLVQQLALQDAHGLQVLEDLYSHCLYGQTQPSRDELVTTFQDISQGFSETYIIIDALDECAEIEILLNSIKVLTTGGGSIHVLATSRPDPNIKSYFESLSAVAVPIEDPSIKDDIYAYIHETIYSDPRLARWPADVQEEIEKSLVAGAHGMFRWVACQLEAIRRCLKITAVRKTLDTLPKTLDETYARILLDIPTELSADAFKVLQLLTHSRRPLRIEEAVEVVAIDPYRDPPFEREDRLADPNSVLELCPSLLVTSPVTIVNGDGETIETEVLQLAHFSVKEYLLSNRILHGPLTTYYWMGPGTHIKIAEMCLAYLFSISAKDLLADDFPTQFPLYLYASREWVYHAREAPQGQDTDDVVDQLDTRIEQLLTSSQDLVNWLRMFDPEMSWKDTLNPHKHSRETCSALYYASSLGLIRTVRKLLTSGVDVNRKGGNLGSPLQAAAYHGHTTVVEELLRNKANYALRCGWFGNAFQAAKFARHKDIIAILEKYDVSENTEDSHLPGHIHLLASETPPFQVLDSLGHGCGVSVDKVRNLVDGRICARKTCDTPSSARRKAFFGEVQIIQKLHHLHVVEVLGSYSRGKISSMLLLPVADGDLGDFMEDLDHDSRDQVDLLIKWTACLAEGLRYIHSQNVKHKDIKPQNLLFHGENILYTDFGIAHEFEGNVSATVGGTGYTRRYSAPEVVGRDARSRSADVFSLGCVFLEMLAKIFQWRLEDFNDDDPYDTYIQDHRAQVSNSLDSLTMRMEPYKSRKFTKVPGLTQRMLATEPTERPKALELASDLCLGGDHGDGSYSCC